MTSRCLTQALLRLIDAGYGAALRPAAKRFERATHNVARAQEQVLARILADNADTAFGRAYGFGSLASAAEFQNNVPRSTYRDMAPYISRVGAGEERVLTAADVLLLQPTSGSTEQAKLIPLTRPFLHEVNTAVGPWLYRMLKERPRLAGTRSYWSLSPAARAPSTTPGGLRIGFADDTEYLGFGARFVWRHKMAVSPDVAKLSDITTWQRRTLSQLLAADDLGLISVWSPTFLISLMRAFHSLYDELLSTLPKSRAEIVRTAVRDYGEAAAPAIWPRLALISCWTDAAAALFLPELRRLFPGVEIQGKGLIATEGVVSVPYETASAHPVAAITGHFLEFARADRLAEHPLLAHELCEGQTYCPLLSTGAGLFRYELGDVVTCVGHYNQAPLLRFDGKRDAVSDLCGEKLHAAEVEAAIAAAKTSLDLAVTFAVVAPKTGTPTGYVLYVDSPADDATLARFAANVEVGLQKNFHYRYCRDLGQLAALRALRTHDGWRRFEAAKLAAGARLGDIKPVGLDISGCFAPDLRAPATPHTHSSAPSR